MAINELLKKIKNTVTDKKITCPYCMSEVSKNSLEYECKRCTKTYPIDFKGGECTNIVSGVPCGGVLCIKCSSEGCKKELPAQIFEFDQYIKFCIVGHTDCGKTNYITVMLHEFQEKLNEQLLMRPMNQETQNVQKDNEDYLYNQQQVVPATPPGTVIPQQWQITDRTRYNKLTKTYKVYSMTLFDGAGENYKQMDDTIRRYISGSDYIFFLVDPLRLKGFRKEEQYGSSDESKELVTSMSDYLRRCMNLRTGTIISKPLAVILTKFDEIMPQLPHSSQILQEGTSPASGEFLQSDADAINEEIRSMLKKHNQPFLSTLDAEFEHVRFFGVSSYGHAPEADGLGKIAPHRVLDPVLWVLSEKKIIKKQEVS